MPAGIGGGAPEDVPGDRFFSLRLLHIGFDRMRRPGGRFDQATQPIRGAAIAGGRERGLLAPFTFDAQSVGS